MDMIFTGGEIQGKPWNLTKFIWTTDMSCHTIGAYLTNIKHTSMWNDAIDHSQLNTYSSTLEKGPDKVTVVMERADTTLVIPTITSHVPRKIEMDEVKNYLSCRYVSAAEASWRIFGFPIHYREPYVQRLYFHLEDEQEVLFRDDEALPQIIGRFRPDSSMFVQWLLNNRRDESGRDLTYVRYPIRYRWDNAGKFWAARKQKIDVVGRMVYAHPASGERFYMRLLLNHVASAKSFEDIRTVDGIVYPTYKEACFHRGLLESDKE